MTIDEIMKKSERIIGLSVPYDKTRATILAEVHEKLDPIITCIDDFIATKPKLKRDVYAFLEKQYNPACTYAYHAWDTTRYAFTNVIMMENGGAKSTSKKFFCVTYYNILQMEMPEHKGKKYA